MVVRNGEMNCAVIGSYKWSTKSEISLSFLSYSEYFTAGLTMMTLQDNNINSRQKKGFGLMVKGDIHLEELNLNGLVH